MTAKTKGHYEDVYVPNPGLLEKAQEVMARMDAEKTDAAPRRLAASLAAYAERLHPDDQGPYRAVVRDIERRTDFVEDCALAARVAATYPRDGYHSAKFTGLIGARIAFEEAKAMSDEDLLAKPGVGPATVRALRGAA